MDVQYNSNALKMLDKSRFSRREAGLGRVTVTSAGELSLAEDQAPPYSISSVADAQLPYAGTAVLNVGFRCEQTFCEAEISGSGRRQSVIRGHFSPWRLAEVRTPSYSIRPITQSATHNEESVTEIIGVMAK